METLKDLYDSDHLPIKITYGDNTTTGLSYHQPKWKIRKTNWPVYQENITLQLTEKEMESELDSVQINKIINSKQISTNYNLSRRQSL